MANRQIRPNISNIRVLIMRYQGNGSAWVEETKKKKRKPFAFHRDFHLPDWLGVGRETELALKRRIVRGQSTEEVWNKKGNHLRPVSRSQITRLPGKGAGMLSVLAAVSRGGMLKGQESIWHSRAGYEIAVCLVKWMGWFRIIGNGCRRVDIQDDLFYRCVDEIFLSFTYISNELY